MHTGDKCPNCKKGYIKQINGREGEGRSISNLMTLVKAGDDIYSYYECQNCFKQFKILESL